MNHDIYHYGTVHEMVLMSILFIIYANGSLNLNTDGVVTSYAYNTAISVKIDYQTVYIHLPVHCLIFIQQI